MNTKTGQTIELLIVPEINERIRTQVALGLSVNVQNRTKQLSSLDPRAQHKQLLSDVLAWLVINNLRIDGLQFNLLCEQSVSNIWRKGAFNTLLKRFHEIGDMTCTQEVLACLNVFRERVDFAVENMVPVPKRYSDKIQELITKNQELLRTDPERNAASFILNIIRDAEVRNQALVDQMKLPSVEDVTGGAPAEIAQTQAFNREQVSYHLCAISTRTS
jgi:hypothetical protein